jgi:hypothetical protein
MVACSPLQQRESCLHAKAVTLQGTPRCAGLQSYCDKACASAARAGTANSSRRLRPVHQLTSRRKQAWYHPANIRHAPHSAASPDSSGWLPHASRRLDHERSVAKRRTKTHKDTDN